MTFKKAYVRTTIIEFVDKLEKENDKLTIQLFMDNLPEIYKKMKTDPEQPLGGMPYELFYQAAHQVLQLYANSGWGVLNENSIN